MVGKKEEEETTREAAAKEFGATSPLICAHLPLPPLGLHGPLHGRRLGRLDHPGLADGVRARLDGGVGHGGADLGRALPVELAALLHLVDRQRVSRQLRCGVRTSRPRRYLASPGGFVVGLQVLVVVVELGLLLLLLLLQGHQVGVLLLQLPLQPLRLALLLQLLALVLLRRQKNYVRGIEIRDCEIIHIEVFY